MKQLNGYRITSMVVGSVVGVMLAGVEPTKADFVFGAPTKVPNVNSSSIDTGMTISPDGLELYFMSNRPYGADPGYCDLWVATRVTANNGWGAPVNLGPPISTTAYEGDPSLSADGLELYFNGALPGMSGPTQRPGGSGGSDLWVSRRATRDDSWTEPVNLGAMINTSAFDGDASLTADGLQMFFGSDRPGGHGNIDLYVAVRATTSDLWGPPVNLGSSVNTPYWDSDPEISPDGLTLFFSSYGHGGYGTNDLWMTRRATRSGPWGSPVNLGPIINTSHEEADPSLASDGSVLYFGQGQVNVLRSWDLWQAPIIPIVDFNGDGHVNGLEVCKMAEHWGQNEPSCDIGPMPWGDDIVDEHDLFVLAEYIGQDVNDPTLVAHWNFDETEGILAHESISENDATIMGAPVWQPAGGAVDGALELNGMTFLVAGFVLNPVDGPFSVLAWVKGGGPSQAIISQVEGANWLMADPATGALMTELSITPDRSSLCSEAVITDGDWHRVGLAWDGSNRRLYMDDLLVAEDTQDGLASSSGGMLIGCGKDMAAGTFWEGLIDDVRIYRRVVKP